jgi:pimeloyl-ACP methyl ester carboxylesterase
MIPGTEPAPGEARRLCDRLRYPPGRSTGPGANDLAPRPPAQGDADAHPARLPCLVCRRHGGQGCGRSASADTPGSGLATDLLGGPMSMQAKPSIVFAHGLWADGSCFNKVIPTLQAEGHQVVSAQNSLDTLKGDVSTVRRALGRVSSPAILVGHSYGGTVITAAGTDDRVAGLVYIAALAPDETETSQTLQDKFPKTDIFGHIEVADGRIWMLPDGIECFAGDLSEKEQKEVWATQGAPDGDLFNQKLEGTAWKSKPSWYIVSNNDRTVHPDLERFCAQRMGATTFEADNSHVAMLSDPGLVTDVIRTAAAAV